MDQPMDLLTKTNAEGSQVIRKLSRDEKRQMKMFKKMSKQEKKLFAVKHMISFQRYVPRILKEKLKGPDCENCHIECKFGSKGIYCLTFKELCREALYSPMYYGNDPEKGKVMRPIVNDVCVMKNI